jgi:hypothetical protein
MYTRKINELKNKKLEMYTKIDFTEKVVYSDAHTVDKHICQSEHINQRNENERQPTVSSHGLLRRRVLECSRSDDEKVVQSSRCNAQERNAPKERTIESTGIQSFFFFGETHALPFFSGSPRSARESPRLSRCSEEGCEARGTEK